MSAVEASLVVCDQCALVHRWRPLHGREVARCSRCEAVIGRGHRHSIDTTLALSVAAAAVFLVANATPLIWVGWGGLETEATLPEAIVRVWREGDPLIALVAAFTAMIAPALYIGLRLYVLAPLTFGRRAPGFAGCVRLLHRIAPWSMVEVLTIGVLISLVRLANTAEATPGLGLMSMGLLTFLLAAIESAGLKHLWWQVR